MLLNYLHYLRLDPEPGSGPHQTGQEQPGKMGSGLIISVSRLRGRMLGQRFSCRDIRLNGYFLQDDFLTRFLE